jgi:putative SOS response-associated peptidase YedK
VIYLKSRKPFAFPGLWDCWLDRDTGSELYTFTIITTRANAIVRRIHDRMPVIYDAAMGRQRLEGPFGGRAIAAITMNDAQISQKFIGSGNDEGSRQDVAFLDAKATG